MIVADASTGNVVWQPTTTQTSLIYGQFNNVDAHMATPLSAGSNYVIYLGAFDSENWMFAASNETYFTTTDTSGGIDDENAIRALYESIKTELEAHNADALIELFSQDYMHNGDDFNYLYADMQEWISHIDTLTYDITGISIAGNKASVTASINVTFDNQSPISFTEPNNGEEGLGMGWLIQENGVWLVYGNQTRSEVDIPTFRQPDGSYQFRVTAAGNDLVEAIVSGPNIEPTVLEWDPTWDEFKQWITPSQVPQVGDEYTFELTYGNGYKETLTDTVTSLVPVGPTLDATVQSDNTILFSWDDVSDQVPGASYYWVRIQDQNGYNYFWSSEDLSLSTTAITSEVLVAGVTYSYGLYLYNEYGDAAEYGGMVTIPGGGEEPPPVPTSL